MCRPSTGRVEDSSSAHFHPDLVATPNGATAPVEGQQMDRDPGRTPAPKSTEMMSEALPPHEPVMVEEVVALMSPAPPGLVIDATVGDGGHARALLEASPHLVCLGLDRDPVAVARASATLAAYGDRAAIRHARFDILAIREPSGTSFSGTSFSGAKSTGDAYIAEDRPGSGAAAHGIRDQLAVMINDAFGSDIPIVGALFDLGVRSGQLDDPERGFSYRSDGPLDMRMDQGQDLDALVVINTWPESRLAELIAAHGEERFARRIAHFLCAARPLATTSDLAGAVEAAIPHQARRRGHPASRVFQAVRVAVNDELVLLRPSLDGALSRLVPGGRCVVLSYHSGEDRIVKAAFTYAVTGGCRCPPRLPCHCGAEASARWLVRGSRRPAAPEVARNPRSKSARLRAVQTVGGASQADPVGMGS